MKKKKKVAGKLKQKVVTGRGILSYCYLVEPDSGRQYSDDKYKTDFLMPQKTFKEDQKALRAAVLAVGRAFFKDDDLQLSDFANPFKDTNKLKNYSKSDRIKNCILVRAKSDFPPNIVDASKDVMREKDAEKIKGGDEAILVLDVYPYGNDDGGVTVGLNTVQFLKSGEALGGGRAAALQMLDEIEIEADEIDVDDEDEEDDETPPKKAAKRSKAVEEDDEDEEEEVKPKKTKKPVKKAKVVEEDDDDSDDLFSEDEDEEETPKAKKKNKKSASEEEDDDSSDFDFDD